MNECISTLPISPRLEAQIGYYSIVVVIDILAKCAQLPLINSINILGAKNISTEAIDNHFKCCKKLGVNLQEVFDDKAIDSNLIINEVITEGLSKGWVVRERSDIYSCQCGLSQFSAEAKKNSYNTSKLISDKDDKQICKKCDHDVELVSEVDSLFLKIPENVLINYLPQISPDYLRDDYANTLNFFRGKNLLISRIMRENSELEFENLKVDIDLSWMCYLFKLQNFNFKVNTLPFGKNVIKQVVLCLILSDLLNLELPRSLIALPYLKFDFGNKVESGGKEIIESTSTNSLRSVLARGIGSKSKDLIVSSKEFYQFKDLTYSPTTDPKIFLSSVELWKTLNPHKIHQTLLKIKKGQALNQEEEAIASGIFSIG